jgi:uncharacterized protein (TIRG00374 family)
MTTALPERAALPAGIPRPRTLAIRFALGALVFAVVVVVLAGKRGDLLASLRRLAQLQPLWVGASLVAEAGAVAAFTLLQRKALRAAGVRAPLMGGLLVSMASNAIASSVPGEPVVSSAYRYRCYRRWGSTAAGAAWTIFVVLVSQSIGMSALLLVGVLVALATGAGSVGTAAAAVAAVVIAVATAVLVRRDLLLRVLGAGVAASRRLTGRPRQNLAERIDRGLRRMREIPLGPAATLELAGLGALMWTCDCLCLAASFRAIGAAVPWDGLLVAYGAAQIVSSIPVVPGGFGLVEGSLSVILVAYGVGHVPAVSVTLLFRLVTFWLAIAAGWCAAGVVALGERRERSVSEVAASATE